MNHRFLRSPSMGGLAVLVFSAVILLTNGCTRQVQTEPSRGTDPSLSHPTQVMTVERDGYTVSGLVTHLEDAKTFKYAIALFPGSASFRLDDALWARAVYDFAMGDRQRVMDRGQLLRSLTPIYLGWLAGFVAECGGFDPAAVEARVERLCLAFEAEKPYLISRWRWPDRFNP